MQQHLCSWCVFKNSYKTPISRPILTEKGNTFTSLLLNKLMQACAIKIDLAKLKHGRTNKKVEQAYQKRQNFLNIKNKADHTPHWDGYVKLVVMTQKTTHHLSLKNQQLKLSMDAFHTTHYFSNLATQCILLVRKSIWKQWSTKATRDTKRAHPKFSKFFTTLTAVRTCSTSCAFHQSIIVKIQSTCPANVTQASRLLTA